MSNDRLIWMDLEMTGLNPQKDRIIEIATLVTDNNLNLLQKGPVLVIQTPLSLLNSMDEWCTQHHGQSGLTKKALESTITMKEAASQTLDFLKQWVKPEQAPLCGNSIHQDRRFLEVYMPKINSYLHYRNIDVSTLKELAKRWRPDLAPMLKKGAHTALEDILESIEELKHYRQHLFVPPSA